jgi:hypothetical protein
MLASVALKRSGSGSPEEHVSETFANSRKGAFERRPKRKLKPGTVTKMICVRNTLSRKLDRSSRISTADIDRIHSNVSQTRTPSAYRMASVSTPVGGTRLSSVSSHGASRQRWAGLGVAQTGVPPEARPGSSLDRIEFGDPPQGLGGDQRTGRFTHVVELTPCGAQHAARTMPRIWPMSRKTATKAVLSAAVARNSNVAPAQARPGQLRAGDDATARVRQRGYHFPRPVTWDLMHRLFRTGKKFRNASCPPGCCMKITGADE